MFWLDLIVRLVALFLCLKFLFDGLHAGFQGCAYGEDNED